MTQEQHPITPPPELVREWVQEVYGLEGVPGSAPGKLPLHIATQAANWGADKELEACCEWLETYVQRWAEWSASFRAARRPKPPSLKERALEALQSIKSGGVDGNKYMEIMLTLEKALEALPDD